MTKMHRDDSCSETLTENSSKFIVLGQDSVCELSCFDDKYLLQYPGSHKKYVDFKEMESSGEHVQEEFEDQMASPPLHSYNDH